MSKPRTWQEQQAQQQVERDERIASVGTAIAEVA